MVEGRADPEIQSTPSALNVNLLMIKRMLKELRMPDTDNLEEGRSLVALAFVNNPQGLQVFQDDMVRNNVLTIKDSSGSSDKDDDSESIKKAKLAKC